MQLSIVLVHYHTPALAAAAVAALRADLGERCADCELLLVDNGSDADGQAVLASLPVRRLVPGTNLGFAGGVNFGAAQASGDVLVLMNPDVVVAPGCLAALVGELESGADVVGPRFFWDAERRLLLPPAERRTRAEELWRALAPRGGRWAALARGRWRRHARRHWQATAPLPSFALSGALLAVRRDAWERVGPFDEGYRLYFEESDWLARAAAQGLTARYVPAAAALHHFAQSAAREPQAADWFEESAARFRRRHYGTAWAALVERLGRHAKFPSTRLPALPRQGLALDLDARRYPLWLEISAGVLGFPAAATVVSAPRGEPWRPPEPVAGRLAAGEAWQLRVSDRRGREVGRFALGAER